MTNFIFTLNSTITSQRTAERLKGFFQQRTPLAEWRLNVIFGFILREKRLPIPITYNISPLLNIFH